jgi:intracellular sulfur oxidation DsrE/DsrF family protein
MKGIKDLTTRRGLIVAAATGAMAATAKAAPPMQKLTDLKKEGEVACIYHCDFGAPDRFNQMLTNIANHYSVYGADPFALQLVIVAHGAGIKFFLDNLEGTTWKDEKLDPALFERVVGLSKNGLKVHLCEITFKRQNINVEKARTAPFIAMVPSGVATVAALQSKGFAYLKVG